ncbi:hypothetical protein [Crocosphaera sp. XPORK-15E]|uniref:hypothetical protein n=1 Tax=Crocosphaera sp. XPORK-15E TaxID=3110247 RepID=UPI002B205259|nr:hypothetical protein [Crocosphaera sp. XPORK-15E]MEA5537024.1 hypothetical protein [Crocosphaera sp. XPORK-15E]
MHRRDYPAVQRVLRPYKNNADDNDQSIKSIWNKLDLAIAWNMADFDGVAQLIDETNQQRTKTWWWTAYEAAYLAVIRFQQGHTTEAFFHSFRAVEGLMIEWAIQYYNPHVNKDKTPILQKSICKDSNFPESKYWNSYFDNQGVFKLFGEKLEKLLMSSRTQLNREHYWKNFAQTREQRNQLFHRLYKLDKKDLFQAWNANNQKEWEDLILSCLNSLSSQTFLEIKSSSLLFDIHNSLKQEIQEYGKQLTN